MEILVRKVTMEIGKLPWEQEKG